MREVELGEQVKPHGGFSYIEILIAMAIFSLLTLAVLPLLTQAARNLATAEDGHAAHLAAQSIMLAVRDTLAAGGSQSAAEAAAAGYADMYSVWIFSEGAPTVSFGSADAPAATASLAGLSDMSLAGDTRVVVVTVWNEHLHMAGRAIGVVY